METFLILILAAAILWISFLATAGLVWVICWAFGWTFGWKLAVGVWVISILVSGAVKSTHCSGK